MKVELIKDEESKTIGWNMTAETEEEINTVNTVRNLSFFGSDDTGISYAGRKGGTLFWKQRKHIVH